MSRSEVELKIKDLQESIVKWNESQPKMEKVNVSPLIQNLSGMLEARSHDEIIHCYGKFIHTLIERRPRELYNHLIDQIEELRLEISIT